jgi:hypothetical protein
LAWNCYKTLRWNKPYVKFKKHHLNSITRKYKYFISYMYIIL